MNKKFAFVFPGQGSQSVGMLDAWSDHPVVVETLKEASDALNEDVAALGARSVDIPELLEESDIITLHAPLLPETHHLIDADAIDRMKQGVMLINTSRGALIDSLALVAGLKTGRIGAAGLDVYEEEAGIFFHNYANNDWVMLDDVLARLLTFNNVIVTSHQGFLTHEALDNIAATTLENLHEFESGKRGAELSHSVVISS